MILRHANQEFPLISEAALRNRRSAFVIDGEAVLLGADGRSDFSGLHSRKHDHDVQVYLTRPLWRVFFGAPSMGALLWVQVPS